MKRLEMLAGAGRAALLFAAAGAVAGCNAMQDNAMRAPWEGPVTPQTQMVEKAVNRVLRSVHGAEVAVAYLDIATGSRVLIREMEPFHAASVVKIPILVAAWEAVDSGDLSLGQAIPVRNEFRSIVDGSRYHLNPVDDGDAELYAAVGGTRPLSDLMQRMILRNSDLATNVLVERLTASRISEVLRRVGAYETHVVRGVEDEKAFQANFNNEITAGDMMLLMQALHHAATTDEPLPDLSDVGSSGGAPLSAPVISHRGAKAIVELLETPIGPRSKIAAAVPAGTPVAHKAADIKDAGIHHDVAVVYPPGESPYVLVLLTYGFSTQEKADKTLTDLSRAVWQARHQPLPPASPAKHQRGATG